MSIRTAGGNTKFSKEEQFKYCPVCGSALSDEYAPKRYTLFYIRNSLKEDIQGIGMCPTNKLSLRENTEIAIGTFDAQEDLIYLLNHKFPDGRFSASTNLAKIWSDKLLDVPWSELDYLKRFVYFYWE
jgi:hypothetical protein